MIPSGIWLVAATLLRTSSSQPGAPGDIEAEVMRICHAEIDTPQEATHLSASAEAMGEEGRKEFLKLVRGRRREAACALNHLVEMGDPRAVPLIREILNDRKADVWLKQAAVAGAGRIKDPSLFDGVLAAFKSGNTYLVEPAAVALAALGDERGLAVLREALAGDLRFAVVKAAGFDGHEAAVEPLMRLMSDPVIAKSGAMRRELTLSLARIGTPRGREAAVTLSLGTEDKSFRGRLVRETLEIFVLQRAAARDPTDVADINKEIDRLHSDPSASR
jgi:HEAT repeat protein